MQAQALAEAPFFAHQSSDALLLPSEAAAQLRVDESTLEGWRCRKKYGLPHVKVGGGIRYRKSDIHRWLQARTVNG